VKDTRKKFRHDLDEKRNHRTHRSDLIIKKCLNERNAMIFFHKNALTWSIRF